MFVEKDLNLLKTMMSIKTKQELYENYFCWLYPFTNENINGYYSKIDFNDKSVLSVTSSGDHIINAILKGAKEIDAFDINPLAKYYVNLKIAAIKALNLEQFILFLYNKNIFREQKYYMNYKIYLYRIREHLDSNSKVFWDYLFENYSSKEIYKSKLFTDDFLNIKGLIEANPYLAEDNYNDVKRKLYYFPINYFQSKLEEITKNNKKYDILLLSNIPAFLETKEELQQLKEVITSITKEDSQVILNYYYNNLLDYYMGNTIIYNNEEVRRVFDKYEYYYFESSDNLSLNKFNRAFYNRYDRVLMKNK